MIRGCLSVVLLAATLACGEIAGASWRVEVESKSVAAGATGVTIAVHVAWDSTLRAAVIPLVVRSITPGAFWSGSLPCDTSDGVSHGVTWHNSVLTWATNARELRPGQGCSNTDPYDGVSPDYFVINTWGSGELSAQPDGIAFVTLQFDVTSVRGQFEFDTACFTPGLHDLLLIDHGCPPVTHGPTGTGETDFNKGTIVIGCFCGDPWGDLNNDAKINPVDVVIIVNYVYRNIDQRVYPPGWNCPRDLGDVNCDGKINPVDVVLYVNCVYRNMCGPQYGWCANPCGP